MTGTVWRVTATPLTRRSSTHHGTLDTTTRNASVSRSSYRLFEQAIATTTTRINGTAAVRGGESPLTERLAVPSLQVCGDARRGGRRLWWWPYKEFVNMIRRAAWTALITSGRPRESATLTTDSTANHRPSKASG